MSTTVEAAAAHWEHRARFRRDRAEARARALRARLPEAKRILLEHGARRVFLFGSLKSGLPRESSDVDLAVQGLSPEHYFPALADLMAAFGTAVDLVPLEEACASLRERVGAEGVEL